MAFAIFERWGLNPREQRVATIAVVVLGAFVILAIPASLQGLVSSRRTDNDQLRTTLQTVNAARAQIHDRQARRDNIASRYREKTPPLAAFLEKAARANHLEVSDSVDRPDKPHGKQYVERSTVIHLKKAGMLHIAKFLEAIEKSGHPVTLSRLQIRRRSGEPDSYDVEIGVSAYDRTEAPAPKKKKDG